MPQKEKEQWKGARKVWPVVYASHFEEEALGKEWAEDGNREERLKLKLSSELQGTVRSDWWTHFPSEAVASALDQVKHLLVQNGKSASSFQGPEHDPSQNKQPSVLDPTKLCFQWWLPRRKTDDYWKHTWCCGQTEVVLGSGSATCVCACFRCYTRPTYRISISFHLQNTKSILLNALSSF